MLSECRTAAFPSAALAAPVRPKPLPFRRCSHPHCVSTAGKRLSVAVIGGSVTAGAGSYDRLADAWVDRLEAWLKEFYAPWGTNVTVNNGAVPGERRRVPAARADP